jgi:hypothetical protein
MFDKWNSQNGVAALVALLMIGMLTLIGLAALSTTEDEIQIAGNELNEMKAFYAAEAGLEIAVAELQSEFDSTGAPPTVLPVGAEKLNDCEVHYLARDEGPAEQKVLSVGVLSGLNALVKTFSVDATASSAIDGARIMMEEDFEVALVPIFQFAVFYDNDLEIAPGPDMDLICRRGAACKWIVTYRRPEIFSTVARGPVGSRPGTFRSRTPRVTMSRCGWVATGWTPTTGNGMTRRWAAGAAGLSIRPTARRV